MKSILFFVLLVCSTAVYSVELENIYETFDENLGIFNRMCQPGYMVLRRERYGNHSFPKPPQNTNDFFLTSDRPSCSQTDLYETNQTVQVKINSYRLNDAATTLQLFIIDANSNILYNLTTVSQPSSVWRFDDITFKADTSFRMRLVYNTENSNIIMALDSINITLFEESPPVEPFCINDELDYNSTGLIGNSCGLANTDDMVLLSYSDTAMPIKPLGANNFFLSMGDMKRDGFCTVSKRPVTFNGDNEIIMTVYMENEENVATTGYIFIVDPVNTDVVLDYNEFKLNNTRGWTKLNLKTNLNKSGLIRLIVPLVRRETYFAIDSIGVKSADFPDCTNKCQECAEESCAKSYALIDDNQSQTGQGFGVASMIVSTAVVVSMAWGGVVAVFIIRKKRNNKQPEVADNQE